jgi:hypothetical protein
MTGKDKALCALYGAIAFAALLGTWSQNLAFMALPDNGGALGFIRASGANPAAASIGIDLGFMCLAVFVWMVVEARRLGIRMVWAYIGLSMIVAVSVMFPLFLLARQRRMAAPAGPGQGGAG